MILIKTFGRKAASYSAGVTIYRATNLAAL